MAETSETSYFEVQPENQLESELQPEPKRESRKQLDTPGKNRVLGYIQCCEDHHIKWTKAAVARACKVSRMQVDYAVKNPSPRTKKNTGSRNKNARKITPEDLDAVERYIDTIDFSDGHALNWHDVVSELKLDVTGGHLGELMKPRLARSRIKTRTPRDPKRVAARQQSKEQTSQEQPPQEQPSQVQLPLPQEQLPPPQVQSWPWQEQQWQGQ